jgi:hypothetical protein
MRTFRCVLVLLVAVVFGVTPLFPAEDLPETPYDESEPLPYEGTPLLSGDIVQEPAPVPHVVPIVPSDLFPAPKHASSWAGCRDLAAHHRPNSLIILDHTLRC